MLRGGKAFLAVLKDSFISGGTFADGRWEIHFFGGWENSGSGEL